jgi:hypothetical protein
MDNTEIETVIDIQPVAGASRQMRTIWSCPPAVLVTRMSATTLSDVEDHDESMAREMKSSLMKDPAFYARETRIIVPAPKSLVIPKIHLPEANIIRPQIYLPPKYKVDESGVLREIDWTYEDWVVDQVDEQLAPEKPWAAHEHEPMGFFNGRGAQQLEAHMAREIQEEEDQRIFDALDAVMFATQKTIP